jgi:hypothetical protein
LIPEHKAIGRARSAKRGGALSGAGACSPSRKRSFTICLNGKPVRLASALNFGGDVGIESMARIVVSRHVSLAGAPALVICGRGWR